MTDERDAKHYADETRRPLRWAADATPGNARGSLDEPQRRCVRAVLVFIRDEYYPADRSEPLRAELDQAIGGYWSS